MQLRWLVKEHPQGCWEQFLSADQSEVLWEKVIVAGASHGSFRYEPVRRYLFTHPVTEVGKPAAPAADCRMDHPDGG